MEEMQACIISIAQLSLVGVIVQWNLSVIIFEECNFVIHVLCK